MSQWKFPSNICRCCLANTCYKNIATEYYYAGCKEVYAQMLKETFDIQISQTEYHAVGHSSTLICEDCISRLRNANFFKQLVMQSEESFLNYLNSFNKKESENDEVKVENVKEETIQSAFDNTTTNDCIDGGSFYEDEILPKNNANVKIEQAKIDDIEISLKPSDPREKRKSSQGRKNRAKRAKLKEETDQETNHHKSKEDWVKIAERRGNGPILRENSLKILANSTMCVFQWNKSRYRCFCCMEPFSDVNSLKEHTNRNHTLKNIERKIIIQQNRLVKVEISTLFCKICKEKLGSLESLKEHLSNMHELKFELKEDLLVPFKIESELKCQICLEGFSVFRHLNIHMNKHYQKQVCHICGAGFSNLVFLNLHKSRSHKPLFCKECNLVFKSKIDKKQHEIEIHDVKFERKLRFPCPYCQERFFQENFRVQHLVEKHGMRRPEHKCVICSKVFITKSLCNNHMKNVHLKERSHECNICHHLFYTKSDVSRHKVTHTGEKKYFCTLCNNLFATKDSLRRHVKRSHVGMH